MSKVTYILGVKIYMDHLRKFLSLSQKTYIRKILKRLNMLDWKPMDTLILKRQTLSLKMYLRLLKNEKK